MEFDGSSGNLKKEYLSSGITIEPTAVNGNGTRYSSGDNLASPRVISNASAGVVSRHDYMPFGEELGAGVGGRTTGMGFSVADGHRRKFTGYEADVETGLNFAQARYQSPTQGRFTSPDPFGGSMTAADPQSFNRYSYTGNNPINRTDSSGLDWTTDARFHGQWDFAHQTMAAGCAATSAALKCYDSYSRVATEPVE